MRSAAKRNRRKTQREAARARRQGNPDPVTEDEVRDPASPRELDYGVVLDMVEKINSQLGTLKLDAENIRSVCNGLLRDYKE